MKIGIVVPFSWSYWGGVVEHAENQVKALAELGHDARLIIGNDPPGRLTHLLHPRYGRHGPLPDYVIPVGRTVIVPANGSLSNLCLTPQAMPRMKRVFERECFDVVHVHEPLAPILCQYALANHPCPVVATSHSSGGAYLSNRPSVLGRHRRTDRLSHRSVGAGAEGSRAEHRRAVRDPSQRRELAPNGPIPGTVSSASSSSGGTSRARDCTSCFAPGPLWRSGQGRACG